MATDYPATNPMMRWRLLLAFLAVVVIFSGFLTLMGLVTIPKHGIVALLQNTAWQWCAGTLLASLIISIYAYRRAY